MVLVVGCTKDENSNLSMPSIVLGSQGWSIKNLDVATYSDGTVIPQVTDPAQWATLTTGAWCYYNNDSANGNIYGKLYNWYAVAGIWNEASKTDASQRKKLAPQGWHVSSHADWSTLTDFLGGESIAGGKMKEAGTAHWNSPNLNATNSSGFKGLPGGYRRHTGAFGLIGNEGDWWCSSASNTIIALTHFLYYNNTATNSYGTSKSNGFSVRCVRDATTMATVLGSVSTTTVRDIKTTTATSGGVITSDIGANITSRGVVWSTSPNPTIVLTTKTSDGSGTDYFTSAITGLTPETTYYVRAYATNSAGTSYGTEVSFTTLILGQIGTQIWTPTNLNIATYSDGTVIPEVTDPNAWYKLTTGAWCYYNNDPANGAIYGKLYNWYAVLGIWNEASKTDVSQRKKLAPQGWHVSSDADWSTLFAFVGSPSGNQIKATNWCSTNSSATNSSGFAALPGGYCNNGGIFNKICDVSWKENGSEGWFWSSSFSSYNESRPSYIMLNSDNQYIYRYFTSMNFGMSVRCVKD